MHDTLTIGVPVLAILFGVLVNQRGLDKLESRLDNRINSLEARMEKSNMDLTSRIDRIQADLTRFYQILGEHSGKIDLLSKK